MRLSLPKSPIAQKAVLHKALTEAGISVSYNIAILKKCKALSRAGWDITDYKGCIFDGNGFNCESASEYLARKNSIEQKIIKRQLDNKAKKGAIKARHEKDRDRD